jgi:hypothetical protein
MIHIYRDFAGNSLFDCSSTLMMFAEESRLETLTSSAHQAKHIKTSFNNYFEIFQFFNSSEFQTIVQFIITGTYIFDHSPCHQPSTSRCPRLAVKPRSQPNHPRKLPTHKLPIQYHKHHPSSEHQSLHVNTATQLHQSPAAPAPSHPTMKPVPT